MADQTESLLDSGSLASYQVIKAAVSTSDTITIDALTQIFATHAIKASDYSAITVTASGNVITITQASLTNVVIVVFVAGI